MIHTRGSNAPDRRLSSEFRRKMQASIWTQIHEIPIFLTDFLIYFKNIMKMMELDFKNPIKNHVPKLILSDIFHKREPIQPRSKDVSHESN
jgi:hypothetical protein